LLKSIDNVNYDEELRGVELDRKAHWEKVYREKAADSVSWFQSNPDVSLSLIKSCHLDIDDSLIDVGGGSSVLIDSLINLGHQNLSVLDISSAALSNSQERLGSLADRVNWLVEDVTNFQAPQKYSLWHDRAVFHFLTDKADREKYIEALKASLSENGYLILASFAIGGPEKCSGLPIVQYDEEKIMNELGAEFELVESKNEVHLTPWESEQSFKYFRLKRI